MSNSGSTRASSPESSSSSSTVACSLPSSPETERLFHGSHSHFSTLADKRGVRAAILNDLGVELEEKTMAPHIMRSPARSQCPHRLSTTPSGKDMFSTKTQMSKADASQRSPAYQRSPLSFSAAKSPTSLARVNSTLVGNCLSSSPASCGDASQRTPVGAPRSAAAGQASWSGAMRSVQATQNAVAAQACAPTPTHATMIPAAPVSCAVTACAVAIAPASQHASTSTQCRTGASTMAIQDDVMNDLLTKTGLRGLSSEDVAMQLRAALPTEYED